MRAERCARAGEPRLQETMNRVAVDLAEMAGRALGVADAVVAEKGVRSPIPKPVLELGLQLLARSAWSPRVTIRAGKRFVASIRRAFCIDALKPGKHQHGERRQGEQ